MSWETDERDRAEAKVEQLTEQLAAARAECEWLRDRRFRIMGAGSVPWRLVAPYEDQAKNNHDQSLERLNERGGLDPTELWCIVHGKRLRERPSAEVASAWLDTWRQHDIVADLARAQVVVEAAVKRKSADSNPCGDNCGFCTECKLYGAVDAYLKEGKL